MAGVKETKELLAFACELGNGLGASLADGRIGYGDLMNIFGALRALPGAVDGAHLIVGELKDLDPDEKVELCAMVEERLDIPQDSIEPMAEKAMCLAVALGEFIVTLGKAKDGAK